MIEITGKYTCGEILKEEKNTQTSVQIGLAKCRNTV